MGLTITNLEYSVFGNKSVAFCDIDFDSSYPTGGEELLPGSVGLVRVDFVQIAGKSGYIFEFDYDNNKVKAMYPRSAQTAVTTDKITITASGAANITDGQSCTVNSAFRSAVTAAVADEVGSGDNLSSLTGVKVMIVGV